MSENTSERARITEEMVEAGLKAFNSYNRNALEFFEDRHVKELVRDVLRAALATPPAQGVEEETETLENLIGAAIGARTAPPWQEQAAQQCEAWAKAHRSTDMELFCRIFADDFRAMARSEKGEEK